MIRVTPRACKTCAPMNEPTLRIGDKVYRKERTRGYLGFCVPISELEGMRLADIPPHSTVDLVGLPESEAGYEFSLTAVNGGDKGTDEYLSIYGGASLTTRGDPRPILDRLRRVFAPMMMTSVGLSPNPSIVLNERENGAEAAAVFSFGFAGRGDTLVREAIEPLLGYFRKLVGPEVHLFICHASEDKAVAHALALFLHHRGANVWFDRWEIRVGDSIVQKINDALSSISHLAVLLSRNSINKPWVTREFSTTLMRQLADNSVTILPVRLDDSPVPAILADVRYADCRASVERGFAELEQALFPSLSSPGDA